MTREEAISNINAKLHSIHLGDKVERVAQPIAKAIDKTFKTNLQNCGACKRRKDKLNSIL